MRSETSYDVAIIGAGHAGIEAALASARAGANTLLLTMSLDGVANLPCNPAVGGSAKGHLVCEIDALGGEMGRAADICTLQSRMLGRAKGPAVQSLRAQVDRRAYGGYMKRVLEHTPGVSLRQGEVVGVSRETSGGWALTTQMGERFSARAVVVATGTFLGGRIHVGAHSSDAGPDGLRAAGTPGTGLGGALAALGIPLRRFKTGTPPRVHAASVDIGRMEVQPGDEPVTPFSWRSRPPEGAPPANSRVCWLTWTNAETRRVILDNLDKSALYGGHIAGVGARYCPSIEDKMVRFADKERHQVFVEPTGADTAELYLQGLSSSLPAEVQLALVRTIPGLEGAAFTRAAYAIEYDCCDPLALDASLMYKALPGLFGAGQFNGTSGYEEAAAQGLLAGLNAARYAGGLPGVTVERSQGYMGVMVDDLVTRGCSDPYRVMTSRAEYRLLLRQDNAAARLTPLGRAWGIVGDAQWAAFSAEEGAYTAAREALTRGRTWEALRRPEAALGDVSRETSEMLAARLGEAAARVIARLEVDAKYEGYLRRQAAQVAEAARLEHVPLPPDVDYAGMPGLRLEAREKLARVRPRSLGQAARVEGVSPADVAVLMLRVGGRSAPLPL